MSKGDGPACFSDVVVDLRTRSSVSCRGRGSHETRRDGREKVGCLLLNEEGGEASGEEGSVIDVLAGG